MNSLERVRGTIEKFNMIERGENIAVALSGGADSVSLLHILNELSGRMGFGLCAVHLNHQIRGKEADEDEAFVCSLCKDMGIRCITASADVPALAKQRGESLEQAGREARYALFAHIIREKKADKVATAHNMNDRAETVLMRILRGSGLDGLAGIKPVREDGIIRPLLYVPRAEIEKYCSENGLDYRTDSTNSDNDYTRNKIRNELIPTLEREFNPSVVETLAGLAENVCGDAEFLDGYARRLYRAMKNPLPSGKPVCLHIESLKMIDASIARRLFAIAAEDALDKNPELERAHYDALFALLEKQTGSRTDLPHSLHAVVNYGWLAFETEDADESLEFEFEAEVGGVYAIPEFNIRISLEERPSGYKAKSGESLLDLDKLTLPLKIRSRRKGDKIVMFKDGREKKLKSFFIDAKIPRSERDKIPLLVSGGEIAAVIGMRASEKFKADKNTKRLLGVLYERV